MTWISTERGYVNSAHVARVARRHDGTYLLYGANGDSLDATKSFDPTLPIVPASRPTEAVVVWFWTDDARNHREVSRRDVVAWQIDELGAEPILAGEKPLSGEIVLIVHLDGAVESMGNAIWDNLDAALSSLTAEDAERQAKKRAGA